MSAKIVGGIVSIGTIGTVGTVGHTDCFSGPLGRALSVTYKDETGLFLASLDLYVTDQSKTVSSLCLTPLWL